MKLKFANALSLALILAMLLTSLVFAQTAPTITSEFDDYAPGATVNLFGAGWQVGEAVNIFVNDNVGQTWSYNISVTAIDNGTITTSFQLPNWFVATYSVTATGASGTATTMFTDAPLSYSPSTQALTVAVGSSISFSQNVIAASGSGDFIASLKVAGVGNAIPASWVSTSPSTLSFTNSASAVTKSWNVTFNIPADASCATYTANIKASPSTNLAEGPGTSVSLTVTGCAPANTAPTVNKNNASVTVNEGATATNTGTWSDANMGDTVALSASIGTVTKSGSNAAGTWSWSFGTTDGPNQSQTVTITANDGNGGISSTTFSLTVNNVAPTLTISGAANADEGSAYTLNLSSSDPGIDTIDHWTINWGDGPAQTVTGNPLSVTHTYADGPNDYIVSATATDEDGTFNANTQAVHVNNAAPTANANGPYSVNEGGSVVVSGSGSDPGLDALTYSWDLDNNGTFETPGQSTSFSAAGLDGPSSKTVALQVCDEDGACASSSAAITILNVAPTVTLNGPSSANEGQTKSYNYTTSDPGIETFSHLASCGTDGILSNDTFNSGTGVGSFDCSFPDGPASSTVEVTVDDGDSGSDNESIVVSVANIAPTMTLNGPSSANEGQTKSYSYTTSDPGVETFSHSASCGANGTLSNDTFNSATGAGSFDCTFPDGPASSTVEVTVDDGDGGTDGESISVTVANVAPTVSALTVGNASAVACLAGNPAVTLNFSFTDLGVNDSPWVVTINWGDGNLTTYNATSQGAQVQQSHTYGAGSFTITVSVTDKDLEPGSNSSGGAVSLLYNTSGILQPINLTGTRSSFKIGSTIPVKIKVTDCLGQSVSGLTLNVRLQKLDGSANPVNETAEVSVPDAGTLMRYDASAMQYIYNLSTKRSQLCSSAIPCTSGGDLTSGTYRVTVSSPAIALASADFDTR